MMPGDFGHGWSVSLAFLASALLFLLALRALRRHRTAPGGLRLGMVGMALAVGTTLYIHNAASLPAILVALFIGAVIGSAFAQGTPSGAMPQLLEGLRGLLGLAAMIAGAAAYVDSAAFGITGTETGTVSASGHVGLVLCMAFGAIVVVGSVILLIRRPAVRPALASLLNACLGWAAAALGLALQNPLMIFTGGLVGASAAMLALTLHRARGG